MRSFQVIILLIAFVLTGVFSLHAQEVKTYEADWKRVETLINERALPKTAFEEVKKIYAKAKKEGQDAQVIKALVYINNLQEQNREDNDVASIKELEKEITASKEPSSSILKSMLATQYWQYFQQNRWKLYNRTATINFNKADIATWTTEDFHKKISALYLQSLKNETLLKSANIEAYNAIIVKGNSRSLRPTLFDLLAHQAIQYFKSSERDIKKPAYAFEIIQQETFAPAAEFAKVKFITKDTLSLQHKALLVYQQLIAFHLADKDPAALIDADIQRLLYVYQNAVLDNKEELYIAALNNIISKYSNQQTSQAKFLLAQYFENLASQYQPFGDTTNRFARIKAKELLESVVKDSSKQNEGWINSYNLLKNINTPSFSFEVEKVNSTGLPFRALVRYRNVAQLNFRLIPANKINFPNYISDKNFWKNLTAQTALTSWQQPLPKTADLQTHLVEIKIDALPAGEYILLASANTDFSQANSIMGAQKFHVSNISYVYQGNQFFIVDRESGQPLNNAAVEIFKQKYNYKTSAYENTSIGNYKTDKNGLLQIKPDKDQNEMYQLDIRYRDDHLHIDDAVYTYFDNQQDRIQDTATKVFYFTDRSIYRPGQTVYFKGIAINSWKKENNLLTSFSTKVFLQNANGDNIDSLQVTTNEFGSFNGQFKLPTGVLNGSFTIYDDESDDQAYFSVEEYKRPKFVVAFEKPKGTYNVNDSISVQGTATAYAGNVTNGAKVSYRVVRLPRFLYPWLVKIWPPRMEYMEIAHGETTTDAAGKFSVTFKAIPDAKLDRKTNPVFDYKIFADVTDLNGETRSAETDVAVAYQSIAIKADIPEKINGDTLKTLAILTENMNGVTVPAKVNIQISKLMQENRLIRSRYWERPDVFVFTKEQYINYFPYDEYNDESNMKTWPKGETVYNSTDSANGKVALNKQLEPGSYAIEITGKDKEGAEIKTVYYTEVFSTKTKGLAKPAYLWVNKKTATTQAGEKAAIEVGSSAKDIFLIQQTEKGAKQDLSFTKLDNEKKMFEYTTDEMDKGGFGVAYTLVKNNRLYIFKDVINVPWNKDLTIEYSTFRDKLLPGAEEKWSVKISGTKGEKVAAEMLASMYDASLDQFKTHSWNKPNIWPNYAGNLFWDGAQNFASVQSRQKWVNDQQYKSFSKIYDRFIFGDNDYSAATIRLRGAVAKAERVAVDSAVPAMAAEGQLQGKVAGVQLGENAQLEEVVVTGYNQQKGLQNVGGEIQIRKNLNETAFFFPELRTDKDGNISFSFTAPEALTKWKLQTLAHTKDLSFGMATKEAVTQKELMVQLNMPRFLRQGDRMEISVKVANLSNKEMTGQVQLELVDATTNQSVDGWFQNVFPNQYFTVAAGQSEAVKFPIEVPYLFNSALVWRVTARAENFSDGEESSLPVLTNKVLVTETLPITIKGGGTKNFVFDKLVKSNSETLQHQALTVEFTSNPAWYAVQALPYLTNQPTENAEQVFNRFYANALAATIANAAPRVKQIFEQWKTADTATLFSNLQKNEELKSALLEETPWVLAAKTEEQQKKNLAILFDMVRISSELKTTIEKLKSMQTDGGGFVWLKGAPADRYMTQYIATGLGRLIKLNAVPKESADDVNNIANDAIQYLDKKLEEDYAWLIKNKADLKKQHVGYLQTQYLYMRSFFKNRAIPKSTTTAYSYYRRQLQQFWQGQNKYMQAMTAIALHRTGNGQTPKDILKSLQEKSITHPELGMYWKENSYYIGWFWWQAPIETQSQLIEAFAEINNDTSSVDDMKTWLLKNKQTNNWKTTKATADACYALLLQGSNWLSSEPQVSINLGSTNFNSANQKTEAGTGYFKKTIDGAFVQPQMGNISVTVKQPAAPIANTTSWGAVYWQYFEDMDKVTSAATPLRLTKKLFVEKAGDRGPVLAPVNDGEALKVGDKIKVRIELRVDRDMEYVQMKDMRASALEPVNVISGYKWQGGLGYYETTKDASTSFYFDYLRKGTYVFEYPLFVTNEGRFSNGITTIQCLYAPEFAAHSEGVIINVE